MAAHTPGPWEWQKFGDKICLAAQISMRPIVLSVVSGGPFKGHLTSLIRGLLRPLDPNHPDAKLIAAAPDLLEALRSIMKKIREESGSDDPMEPFAYDSSWEQVAIVADSAITKATAS